MTTENPQPIPFQPPATPPQPAEHQPAEYQPAAQQAADPWRDAYGKERTKFRIAAAAAAVAAVVAAVSLVWGAAQTQTSPTLAAGTGAPGMGAAGGMDAPGGMGAPGMGVPGAGGPGRIEDQLLNADGTVNTDAVAELKAQAAEGTAPPLQMLAQLLPREVQRGDLTQEQADQILAALGLSASGSTT